MRALPAHVTSVTYPSFFSNNVFILAYPRQKQEVIQHLQVPIPFITR